MLLAIETSCDETAAAVFTNNGKLLSDIVMSQDHLHARYGGIVPEVASRRHIEVLPAVVKEALHKARADMSAVEAIAVTVEPGLMGALLVGTSFASGMARVTGARLIPVNHLEGHLHAPFVGSEPLYPFVGLVVSGGHTSLYLVRDTGEYTLLGSTRDDAAGEAFDKVGRILGISYPAGPRIDRIAKEGRHDALSFPRPMLNEDSFDFSFSGLKTAVLYAVKNGALSTHSLADIAASFQEAVVDVLVQKTLKASEQTGVDRIVISGGVAANSRLREKIQQEATSRGIEIVIPPLRLCTDNAAMIGYTAILRLRTGRIPSEFSVSPRSTFL